MAAGRPREFDIERVLTNAQTVFWAKGYEATSIADLSAATGLKPGSIYAAFDSKAGLFEQVAERYEQSAADAYIADAMAAPTLRELVRRWLTGVAEFVTGATTPAGCLLVRNSQLADGSVGPALRARYRAGEAALLERVENARATGDLAESVRPEVVVRFVRTLAEGIAVEAAMGVSRAELLAMVDLLTARLPWESADHPA
ncbi:TetR/AcrR family transcriptional regulator [Nocardia sp. SSK8]|uniref:TetR/AcrR family transcriptional regulator n=1 Tax=Nocardia sp. SSK8 TaxID=3120154 RepID=UPI00300BB4AE